jgi:hypothetical protein
MVRGAQGKTPVISPTSAAERGARTLTLKIRENRKKGCRPSFSGGSGPILAFGLITSSVFVQDP